MIIYKGPSLIDGAPIVVIAPPGRSTNRKTGAMLQTYILRADVSPTEAIRTGADSSICGMCPHRGDVVRGGTPGKGRTCYVNVGQGALAVWKAYGRGRYADVSGRHEWIRHIGRGRMVRLGTYGDPGAVPAAIWGALVSDAEGHTGYTHQWRTSPDLRGLCMASADSLAEAGEAHDEGWRTFRVAMPHEPARVAGEARCPASKEAGAKIQCAECRACGGDDGRRASIVIQAHGGFATMANVRRIAAVNVA